MRTSLIRRLFPRARKTISWLRDIVTGSFYRVSDLRSNTSLADIRTQIDMMRAMARDSQISTALSYYATDATTTNTQGQIIWATADDKKHADVADVINELFERWEVNRYARDHILELATIGNLYLPTTQFYLENTMHTQHGVVLDNNTIPDEEYNVIASTKIDPSEIIHLWLRGEPQGFIYQPDEDLSSYIDLPESAVIHFSLGGLLGTYTIDVTNLDGSEDTYDIEFADPLMVKAIQPTQTLALLENAVILSSLARVIKFINVECNDSEEDEIKDSLQQVKDAIEQQLSLNTNTGDAQSFVNPQSPNNLIYLPKINGQEAISITDLNMAEATAQDNNLLDYYQNKKLSVLGVPKEALNFSSNEGLGGAGSVLSQRSALYANGLLRIETAYMAGWKEAIDKYFEVKGMSAFIGTYTLHMNPIITTQSTIQFEKRDAAIGQASTFVQLLKDIGVTDDKVYVEGLSEILSEVLPKIGSDTLDWKLNVESGSEGGGGDAF